MGCDDQDPLVHQGYPVLSAGGLWVTTKLLTHGQRAVVLFNQTNSAAAISTSASHIGLGGASWYTLLNRWTGATTRTTGAITALLPPHGVFMYQVAVQSTLPLKA
jgi:alpha-galactosidase